MARNTRRTTHPYQHVPARRGVAGYVGVAADAKNDPAVVSPITPVGVPAGAVTPFRDAAGVAVSDDGGGVADPGTVVVQLVGTQTTYVHHFFGDEDPALTETVAAGDMWTDTSLGTGQWFDWQRNADNDTWIPAARPLDQVLLAGGEPGSAGDQGIRDLTDPSSPQDAATKNYVDNLGPFVVSGVDPGAIGAGRIWVDAVGDDHDWKRRNAADDGWLPPFLRTNETGLLLLLDPLGGEAVTIDPDGTITIGVDGLVRDPDGTITIGVDGLVRDPDGTITIGGGFFTLNPDYTWDLNGAHSLAGDADGVKIDGNLVGTQAAFVANGSTVDQLRDALIASGLMAAS